jgi:cell division protein FtsL
MSTRPAKTTKDENRVFAAYAEATQTLQSARTMPLNIQRQWVILFAVGIAVIAMVAGLYLDVTARAAITGREIQGLEQSIAVNRRANADYATDYARLMSNRVMQARARETGFQMLERDSITYMVVPGYQPIDAVLFTADNVAPPVISASAEYHESLFDWLAEAIRDASVPLGSVP